MITKQFYGPRWATLAAELDVTPTIITTYHRPLAIVV